MKNNHQTADTEQTQQLRQRRRRLQKRHLVGMALLGTMMALMLVLSIALVGVISSTAGAGRSNGALDTADGTVRMASRRIEYYGAMNLAETGVRMTVQWMTEQRPPTNPTLPLSTNSTPFYPDIINVGWFKNSTKDDANKYRFVPWDNAAGSSTNGFRVKVYPYTSNSFDTQKRFIIESVGVYRGAQQIVRAAVRQESFANYALFVDNVPTYYLSSGNNAFGGPVHLNASDEVTTGRTINILWKDGNTADPTKDQIFRYKQKNAFTTSAGKDSVKWKYNDVNTEQSPVGTPSMKHVIAEGGEVQTSQTNIPMPTSSTVQADAAYGPTKTAPASTSYLNDIPVLGRLSTIGVALPASGGIVIQGNVEDMVFSVDPMDSTKQIVAIYQRQQLTVNGVPTDFRLRTTISMDRTGTGGTTKVDAAYTLRANNSNWVPMPVVQPSPTTIPNGVIYGRNGNVNGVRGVIADNVTDQNGKNIVQRNALTVATANDKDLQIGGSITYKTLVTDPNDLYEPVGSGDKFISGLLGIVSRKVRIARNGANPEGSSGRVGTSELRNLNVHATVFAFDTFDAVDSGTRSVGIIDLLGGYIAKNGGDFGSVGPTGLLEKGFRKSNNYDDRVLDSPPPAFPSTGNSYKMISFKRVTKTLDGLY
ncbi:MAG: hypothetical protein H7Z41_09145 [Cytophagales bacterium]|nr:hypothetical protein [Armatimonadota bacterium]